MNSQGMCFQSCRICSIKLKNGVWIFGEDGKRMYLQDKIRKYLYITVSMEDKLPKMICENCCKKLQSIHKFATMAVKIQEKFNKLVTDASNKLKNNAAKANESKNLLQTYLLKGMTENEDVTELEVTVDPIVFLKCFGDYNSEDETSKPEILEINRPTIIKVTETKTNHHYAKDTFLKSYGCHICSENFASEIAVQSHMWNHLSETNRQFIIHSCHNNNEIIQEAEVSNSQIPSTSDNSFNNSNEVAFTEREYMAIEQNEFQIIQRFLCPICGKLISTKGNLKVHLETHRPKGVYDCDICGRVFKAQHNLTRHKEYHPGAQFPCLVCGRVYPTRSTLRAHSITHSDLRPYQCSYCIKTFKRNQDLKFHINQHTGARPYKCQYCKKAFASSGNCFSHRTRTHPEEVKRDRQKVAKLLQ